MLLHLPHKTDVLMGSFKVVSILYIGLPASGSNEASGIHDEIMLASTDFSEGIFNPSNNIIIPPRESGEAKAKEKGEPPDEIIIALPSAIHIQAEMTKFSRI